MRMETQGKLKGKAIKVKVSSLCKSVRRCASRCASQDFESPAPQAFNVVAFFPKKGKAIAGNRHTPVVCSCHPTAQSQGW